MTPGDDFFEAITGGVDPALVSEAADRAATLLVRGARDSGDDEVAERLLHLADTEGIETIAEVWSGSPADSLAGCLWRLYLLRSWVYADPVAVAARVRGRPGRGPRSPGSSPASPTRPGPTSSRRWSTRCCAGSPGSDFADVLLRAAAFARVVATGRAALDRPRASAEVRRMLALAEQLEAAGHAELAARPGLIRSSARCASLSGIALSDRLGVVRWSSEYAGPRQPRVPT